MSVLCDKEGFTVANTARRCIRVCKPWRKSLGSRENRHLWRSLEFPKPLPRRNPPSIHALSKLLGYSGNDTRRLVIQDGASLRLSNSKFKVLLRGSPKLECLELHNNFEPLDIHTQLWPRTLTDLSLKEVNPPPSLWEAVASNLVHLDLAPRSPTGGFGLPFLPKLRYLRATGAKAVLRIVRA